MGRKNLDDVIHGDRATVRGNNYKQTSYLDEWDEWEKAGKSAKSSSKEVYKARCYEGHRPLTLPGTDFNVYGGSCSDPMVSDADIYIGFDHSMKFTARSWPWKKGHEFLFKITDMSAPSNPAEFVKLVDWAKVQVDHGKKLHCGCIGGHGRTGTFLAALVSRYGEKDAIGYVRKNYCQKAVESNVQVKFLGEHFGITPASGAKSDSWSFPKKGGGGKATSLSSSSESFKPIGGNGCIFG